MENTLEIKKVSNGFILSSNNCVYNDEEEGYTRVQEVFEIDDNLEYCEAQCIALKNLFYTIMERLDVYNSKHDPVILDIIIKEQNN
jgi:hypothetical protein